MLGVNPATLRQWTKMGKVRVFRTPGGHRRFSAAEIEALSQSADLEPREALARGLVADLRAKYRAFAHSPAAHHGWLASIDENTRRRFHEVGDELLAHLGEYLTDGSPRQRQRALGRARETAAQYGMLAREVGVGTTEVVGAYLVFRRPLLDVLARSLSTRPELSSQLGRIMRDAERFMDDVLVGITEASASALPHHAREIRGHEPTGQGST